MAHRVVCVNVTDLFPMLTDPLLRSLPDLEFSRLESWS